MNERPTAEEITRASKSNLALAFIALSPKRRRDISVFYAFCRIVDDIADDEGYSRDERTTMLNAWRRALTEPFEGEPSLAPTVRDIIARYRIPVNHFHEIIAGVAMDLDGTRYETWTDLQRYCHRVASEVGLVSIEIFGYRDSRCREYAVQLGYALQLTNIIRDVGQDLANGGRVYLPQEDLRRFGCDLTASSIEYTPSFAELMRFETERARSFYAAANAALPDIDRQSMVAAEIMGAVYQRLLTKIERDGFRVFSRRYRLSRLEKTWHVLRTILATKLF